MRLGCCIPRERLARARQVGFDYAELTVTDNLRPLEDDAAWRPIRQEILASGMPVEAANVFFPPTWRLLGPERDPAATRAYVETAVRRARELGIQVMVFGSGRARAVPEGLPTADAMAQLSEVLSVLGEAGGRHGVTIVLEPLRAAETNIVHTVAQAVELVRPLANPHLRALADLYHMEEGGEPYDNLLLAGELLAHVHVADTGRAAPGLGSYDYPGFFARLRQIGYQGRVSIECRWGDWDAESGPALAFLRRMAAGSS